MSETIGHFKSMDAVVCHYVINDWNNWEVSACRRFSTHKDGLPTSIMINIILKVT